MRSVCRVLLVAGLVLAMSGLLLAAEGKRPRGPGQKAALRSSAGWMRLPS